ncbi:hypothetical protein [Schlesneria paludicola]|uniref:hypothetical protein n=1 Tax=Schlesneria paludicola TaxID=360056 RepID=UPI00029AF1EE|nr:hypothetical protein [Schlesneria paludicola]
MSTDTNILVTDGRLTIDAEWFWSDPESAEEPSTISSGQPEYMPTEEEIRAACLEIQAGWSERERMKRGNTLAHLGRPRKLRSA